MTVKNREQAWMEVNRLFPTDYIKDEQASQNAGYPIYMSTADGEQSWISDLGNRIEVNLWGQKSINVWIEAEPEITEEKIITADDVREFCIKHSFYTAGTVAEYEKLLHMVEDAEDYSPALIYRIAKDIMEHSTQEQTIENMMYLIGKEAVMTFYKVA